MMQLAPPLTVPPIYIAMPVAHRIATRPAGVRVWLRFTTPLQDPHDAAAIAERVVFERYPNVDVARLDWPNAFVQFAPFPHCFHVYAPFVRELGPLDVVVNEKRRWIGGRVAYEHSSGAPIEVTILRDLRWAPSRHCSGWRMLVIDGEAFQCQLDRALLTVEGEPGTDLVVRTELGTRFTVTMRHPAARP